MRPRHVGGPFGDGGGEAKHVYASDVNESPFAKALIQRYGFDSRSPQFYPMGWAKSPNSGYNYYVRHGGELIADLINRQNGYSSRKTVGPPAHDLCGQAAEMKPCLQRLYHQKEIPV